MRKLLNQPWFVALLAIAAVVFCGLSLRDQLGGGARPRHAMTTTTPAPEEVEIAPEAPVAMAPTATTITATLAALSLPEKLPDPFRRRDANLVAGDPESGEAPRLPDLTESIRLTAVWQQHGVDLAVVNERIMGPGEQIGRLTIDTIAVDGIWVSHWKGRDFVEFGAEFTLVTPADGPSVPTFARHEN